MSDHQADPRTGEDDDLSAFTEDIARQIQAFATAVAEVARGDSPDSAVSVLLLEVSQLLLAGGRLGAIADVIPHEEYEPDAGYEPDADTLREDLAALLAPIDEYAEVFDPYAAEPEVIRSRLSDDLADVALDLIHGLTHYAEGRLNEALWWWQFSYLSNWGATASAALRALHSVVAHVRLDARIDDETAAEQRLLAQVAAEATGAE
jgi:Domain of unknown function (DUF5063)